MNLLSESLKITLPIPLSDIGGTNTAGSDDTVQWQSMVGVKRGLCYVEIGTWDAGDDLDTAKLEQASDSAGTGKKDLTTSGAGATYDYNASAPIDADGDFIIFDVLPEHLDAANGFTHVRFYGAEGGNTGVDNISCVWVMEMMEQYAQRTATAVAASKLYISLA